MAGKNQPTPFEIALAVKRGKLPEEALRGAAKMLYQNHTKEELKEYVKPPEKVPPKAFTHRTMKRGVRSY